MGGKTGDNRGEETEGGRQKRETEGETDGEKRGRQSGRKGEDRARNRWGRTEGMETWV